MVTANPQPATKPDQISEDDRAPWQRARELLDAGHPWLAVKQCMFADFRARMTFASMLDDEDMAWLADSAFYSTIADIEDAWIGEQEAEAILDELDRRDRFPRSDEPV